MKKIVDTFLLIILFSLSQTAVALHEIHCLDESDSQICQVCAANDHSACNIVTKCTLGCVVYSQKLTVTLASAVSSLNYSLYLCRAPPLPF